ncbi:hypothetical protein DUNSADRAFT_2761 [Dunaliella salina]|uniref:Encoded protein n=1 Tax=Dunaliella salina TaxID=3046 RepID=A0ABQ7GV42_DUNSA|nr:hypothetical protein DUNSADRAFT_2761 [Dunaliella salina]|eukprot:KAF5838491.1 hypothetical protein DUNSADRAFT_2761 [Dunaliella salina]
MSFPFTSDTYQRSQPKGRQLTKGREKPPFLVSEQRFSDKDVGVNSKNSPEYHCAYNGTADKPNRWDTKGWAAIDDAIKPKRGTSTGKLHSSMAPPTSPPVYGASIQPLHAMYPNETRLQELLELQRRKMQKGAPSPGTYEVHLPPRRSTFRRPNHPELDGPYFLGEGEDGHLAESTRGKEIAALIRNAGDSGLGPGEYSPDALAKEVTSLNRSPPKVKIGTSCRDGRAPPRAKSLSVSRSIQYGVNYHVPVIVRTPGEATRQDKETHSRSLASGELPGHRDTAALGVPQDGIPTMSPSQLATGSPPRYMEPIHDTSPNRPPRPVKLLPPPPATVIRAGIPRARSKQPGDWDWSKLGHNFRTTWTTSGGGAYSHGDRKHERRSTSPKETSPQDPAVGGSHLSSLWPAFGPESSSIDITKLPNTHSPIFPIPEDASFNRVSCAARLLS